MWQSTLAAMDEELVSDSLVYRYDPAASPDGLRGQRGHVLDVHLLVRPGPRALGPPATTRASSFEKMHTYANHLGLYSEEIGPTGEQLGNFPQAFSHLALINTARTLGDLLDRAAPASDDYRSAAVSDRELRTSSWWAAGSPAWAARGPSPSTRSPRHAHRPEQLPPVPAAALPGGHRRSSAAATSPSRCARLFRSHPNVDVKMAEVASVDPAARSGHHRGRGDAHRRRPGARRRLAAAVLPHARRRGALLPALLARRRRSGCAAASSTSSRRPTATRRSSRRGAELRGRRRRRHRAPRSPGRCPR